MVFNLRLFQEYCRIIVSSNGKDMIKIDNVLQS